MQEARAYNNSILFMVVTPYLVLGFFGFLVYRGLKTAERRLPSNRTPMNAD